VIEVVSHGTKEISAVSRKEINTSKKGWQKQMAACMKAKEEFTLITDDPNLAKDLANGQTLNQTLKVILLGSSAVATGGVVTGTAVGMGTGAKVFALTGLAAAANPEPVSKTALIVLTGVLGVALLGTVAFMIWWLVQNKYEFYMEGEGSGRNRQGGGKGLKALNEQAGKGKWKIYAKPATT